MRVAVSGHRGLTPEIEAYVTDGITRELQRLQAEGHELTGLSCLADGADQLFARAVLNVGGTLEAVIPADEYRDNLPNEAKSEYDDLLSRAVAVNRCRHRASTSEAHMDASRLMIDEADRLVAVWDGQPARSFGGTADVVDYAQTRGIPVVVIWPAGANRE
ncbi:hypothetical protein AB0F81_29830 [Actinoplanes sp. NPDC024001]|uniref:hypothetical protein n=1 Tax=Actinoplanes sp. NPDC024001 TaxID=3154598 RepID=UPI0033DD3E82